MQDRDWRTWIVVGLGALIVLWLASSLLSPWSHGAAWGMMKPEMMGDWHRGPMAGGWGGGPFGLFFGLIGLMFRLGVLALLVLGAVWFFRRQRGSQVMTSLFTGATCANCGRSVQPEWSHCPYCGQVQPTPNEQDNGPEDASPSGIAQV